MTGYLVAMKTNKQRLVELIDRHNPIKPIPFNTDNIDFKNPVPDAGSHWNTRVTVIGIAGHGYRKEADVYYTRVSLQELGERITLYAPDSFTQDSLLEALNFVKGTTLELSDLESFTIPEISYDDLQIFTLTANPLSLAWIGKLDIQLGRIVSDDMVNLLHHYLHVTLPLREATY